MMIATLVLAAALNLDQSIQRAMHETGATAFAVAVVKDDRVIYQRAFGASIDTPFYLASSAKSLTALTARLLAEEKKLDLDAPLTKTLPALALPAPLDPARMSVRDLLTHRLGFRNDAVIWRTSYSGEWTDEQLFDLLARYTAVTPREFSYDNLGYILTTYAAERAAAEPWASVLSSRVLTPLGMKQTSSRPCASTKSAKTMNRGAGGLCSSIADMTRWLRVNMSDGVLDGTRVFPRVVMRDVHSPQISLSRKFGRIDRRAYALGWYHGSYKGDDIVHHFGSYPGSWAHVSWMPDHGIGVVALSNAYTPLADSVAMLAYDTLLGRTDGQGQFDEDVAKIQEHIAGIPRQLSAFSAKIAAGAAESNRTLQSYEGTYADDALGTVIVSVEGDHLRATAGDRSGALMRARGDAFYVQWYPDDGPERVTFSDDSMKWQDRGLKRTLTSR